MHSSSLAVILSRRHFVLHGPSSHNSSTMRTRSAWQACAGLWKTTADGRTSEGETTYHVLQPGESETFSRISMSIRTICARACRKQCDAAPSHNPSISHPCVGVCICVVTHLFLYDTRYLTVFAPSSVHVLGFDPRHGADQARNYAGKYASTASRKYAPSFAWAFSQKLENDGTTKLCIHFLHNGNPRSGTTSRPLQTA